MSEWVLVASLVILMVHSIKSDVLLMWPVLGRLKTLI